MAYATATWMAIAAITTTVVSANAQAEAQEEAKKNNARSADAQRKGQAEQAAGNAAQAASERRKQVREERVRRARIMQSSEASGTVGSSGETGGIGSLSTQLGANLGTNAGAIQRSVAIGDFSQQAADFSFQAQQSMGEAQKFQQLGQLGSSIFMAGAGMTSKAPPSTSQYHAPTNASPYDVPQ
jgi:hypothetical protein